jgi:uncharacterized protein YdhG (YjbR/CyaY superfamily)
MKTYKNVDEYIKQAPKEYQNILVNVREIIKNAVPQSQEMISYGMPAYKYKDKPLFYFAAMKGHLGIYPTSGPVKALQDDLKDFSTSKGCIRIPWSTKVPKNIIVKLLKERIKEIKLEIAK